MTAAFIHPKQAIVQLPEQIYTERNALLVENEKLKRKLQAGETIRKMQVNRLKAAGKTIELLQGMLT